MRTSGDRRSLQETIGRPGAVSKVTALLAALLVALLSVTAIAADLTTRTSVNFDRYVRLTETRLDRRIAGVLRALIDVQAPYHSFAAKLYKHAAEPASPLSPFSTASSPTRAAAISLYAEVIEGARIRVPAGLRSRLPELLWLYSMGIVLYWVHDSSPGCEKTYRLIDVTAPLAERLVRLARLPVLRSMTRRLLAVLDEVLG